MLSLVLMIFLGCFVFTAAISGDTQASRQRRDRRVIRELEELVAARSRGPVEPRSKPSLRSRLVWAALAGLAIVAAMTL